MGYGRLGSSESLPSVSELSVSQTRSTRRKRRFILLGLLAVILLIASGVSVGLLIRSSAGSSGSGPNRTPTQAISQTCGLTRYPALCINSLLDFPGALDASERDLVHISLNMTVQRVGKALYGASAIANVSMDSLARTAYEDCMELLDDSLDQLSQSLAVVTPSTSRPSGASDEDVLEIETRSWPTGEMVGGLRDSENGR